MSRHTTVYRDSVPALAAFLNIPLITALTESEDEEQPESACDDGQRAAETEALLLEQYIYGDRRVRTLQALTSAVSAVTELPADRRPDDLTATDILLVHTMLGSAKTLLGESDASQCSNADGSPDVPAAVRNGDPWDTRGSLFTREIPSSGSAVGPPTFQAGDAPDHTISTNTLAVENALRLVLKADGWLHDYGAGRSTHAKAAVQSAWEAEQYDRTSIDADSSIDKDIRDLANNLVIAQEEFGQRALSDLSYAKGSQLMSDLQRLSAERAREKGASSRRWS